MTSATPEQIESLTKSVDDLNKKVGRNGLAVKIAAILSAIVICMAFAFAFLLVGQQSNADRIEQDGQRNRTAQCALFSIFFQLEPNLQKSPNYSEEQKANQVQFFKVLHQTADDLGC